MTLAMLADSGLPKTFWWDAYVTSCVITRMMPTRTCRGWMSPAECVPGGNTRRWGCKAYVLIPKADLRKDGEAYHRILYDEVRQPNEFRRYCGDFIAFVI